MLHTCPAPRKYTIKYIVVCYEHLDCMHVILLVDNNVSNNDVKLSSGDNQYVLPLVIDASNQLRITSRCSDSIIECSLRRIRRCKPIGGNESRSSTNNYFERINQYNIVDRILLERTFIKSIFIRCFSCFVFRFIY